MNQEHSVWSGRLSKRGLQSETGFALFTTLIIVIVVGIIAVSGMRLTEMTEVLAGNSIQRSRAFQAAEGGLLEGERHASEMAERRVFSSPNASDGVFAKGAVSDYWWRADQYIGSQVLTDSAYPGVVNAPKYVVEEIGNFETDGGSGIVSLDRGAGGYGRRTASGREVVLYQLQSKGVGSSTAAQAVVESLYVENK